MSIRMSLGELATYRMPSPSTVFSSGLPSVWSSSAGLVLTTTSGGVSGFSTACPSSAWASSFCRSCGALSVRVQGPFTSVAVYQRLWLPRYKVFDLPLRAIRNGEFTTRSYPLSSIASQMGSPSISTSTLGRSRYRMLGGAVE